jgi:acyl-CoA thioester hydrolase
LLDDELEVETSVEALRGASLDMRQIVRRQGDVLINAMVRAACVDATGRPVRLPAEIRDALT